MSKVNLIYATRNSLSVSGGVRRVGYDQFIIGCHDHLSVGFVLKLNSDPSSIHTMSHSVSGRWGFSSMYIHARVAR